MNIRLISEKRTLLIKVDGELDHHLASMIKNAADTKMRATNAINIIFDLSGMTFMDSAGIGVMMGRYKKARSLGVTVIDEAEFLRLLGSSTGISDEETKETEATPVSEEGNLFAGLEEK